MMEFREKICEFFTWMIWLRLFLWAFVGLVTWNLFQLWTCVSSWVLGRQGRGTSSFCGAPKNPPPTGHEKDHQVTQPRKNPLWHVGDPKKTLAYTMRNSDVNRLYTSEWWYRCKMAQKTPKKRQLNLLGITHGSMDPRWWLVRRVCMSIVMVVLAQDGLTKGCFTNLTGFMRCCSSRSIKMTWSYQFLWNHHRFLLVHVFFFTGREVWLLAIHQLTMSFEIIDWWRETTKPKKHFDWS